MKSNRTISNVVKVASLLSTFALLVAASNAAFAAGQKEKKNPAPHPFILRNNRYTTLSPSFLSVEKTAGAELPRKSPAPRSHSVGLLTYFDAQTPGESNTVGLEGRGKFDLPHGKVVNSVSYVARTIVNDKRRIGGLQLAAKTDFLPKAVSLQGRTQGFHAKNQLKMQYDVGPVLDILQKEIAGIAVSAQLTERIHAETPLLEHETTLKARKDATSVTLQGTLVTPLTKTSSNTGKFCAEVTQDFAHNRFQALVGVLTSGKPSGWKNAAQVFTGVRMMM